MFPLSYGLFSFSSLKRKKPCELEQSTFFPYSGRPARDCFLSVRLCIWASSFGRSMVFPLLLRSFPSLCSCVYSSGFFCHTRLARGARRHPCSRAPFPVHRAEFRLFSLPNPPYPPAFKTFQPEVLSNPPPYSYRGSRFLFSPSGFFGGAVLFPFPLFPFGSPPT